MKRVVIFITIALTINSLAGTKVKDKYEWTQYMFYNLFAEMPQDQSIAKRIFESVDNIDKYLPDSSFSKLRKKGNMMDGVAPHEAGHGLFLSLINPRVCQEVKQTHKNYGSYTYDWADETAAVFCETKLMKDNRRGQLPKIIPLKKFFYMRHPIAGSDGREDMSKILNSNATEFYAQSLAISEYMRESGGRPFFRYFVMEQADGKQIDEILANWNHLIKKIQSSSDYRKNSKKKSKELFPKSYTLYKVKILPGEEVKRVSQSLQTLESDFKKWCAKTFKKNDEKLLPIPTKKSKKSKK